MTENFNTLFSNYKSAIEALCDYFDLEYSEHEAYNFVDRTQDYWSYLEDEAEIMWAERRETLENDDCEGSAYVSAGPIRGKNTRYSLFVIQEEYDTYYMICDVQKSVAI